MKKVLLASAAVACLAWAAAASAQETTGDQEAAATEGGIGDIVVTATRQATNMQDTPIAITAITSEGLDERGLDSVADLTAVVPNAEFRRTHGAFGPGISATIRGIGASDTNIGNDPVVAFYVDDIYYPTLLGSNFDLLDIDHVEVLRGPQGTLFGRNTLAGAVNVVSRQPAFGETSGYVEGTVGSYSRTDVRAGFNLPLGENLAFMASGAFKSRTGYQKVLDFACEMNRRGTPELAGNIPPSDLANQSNPKFSPNDCVIGHYGGEDVKAVRGSLAWEPSGGGVRLTITGDYVKDEPENPADTTLSLNPALNTPNENRQFEYYGVAYDDRFITGDPYSTYETYNDPIGAGTVIPGHTYYNGRPTHGGHTLPPFADTEMWGVSGKLVVDLTDRDRSHHDPRLSLAGGTARLSEGRHAAADGDDDQRRLQQVPQRRSAPVGPDGLDRLDRRCLLFRGRRRAARGHRSAAHRPDPLSLQHLRSGE